MLRRRSRSANAHVQRRPRAARLGTGSAQRRVVGRSAGLAPAPAGARGRDAARDCRSRSAAPHRATTRPRPRRRVDNRPPRAVTRGAVATPDLIAGAAQGPAGAAGDGAARRLRRSARRGGRGRRAAADRGRQRLRLRASQPADLSAQRRLEDVLGRVDQRDLDALGRRPPRRRARAKRAPTRPRSGRASTTSTARRPSKCAPARSSSTPAARPSPPPTTGSAPPPKPSASSTSATGPASRLNTDVLDAQVARLQAELDRTRAVANVRLAEARLERALGR